jgi:hypothetical protein
MGIVHDWIAKKLAEIPNPCAHCGTTPYTKGRRQCPFSANNIFEAITTDPDNEIINCPHFQQSQSKGPL